MPLTTGRRCRRIGASLKAPRPANLARFNLPRFTRIALHAITANSVVHNGKDLNDSSKRLAADRLIYLTSLFFVKTNIKMRKNMCCKQLFIFTISCWTANALLVFWSGMGPSQIGLMHWVIGNGREHQISTNCPVRRANSTRAVREHRRGFHQRARMDGATLPSAQAIFRQQQLRQIDKRNGKQWIQI